MVLGSLQALGVVLFGLSIYARRHKPKGKELVLCILSLAISAAIVLYGTLTFL